MILKYLNIDGLISSYLSATLSALALFSSTLSLLVSLSSMSSAVTRSAWAGHKVTLCTTQLKQQVACCSLTLVQVTRAGARLTTEVDPSPAPTPTSRPPSSTCNIEVALPT